MKAASRSGGSNLLASIWVGRSWGGLRLRPGSSSQTTRSSSPKTVVLDRLECHSVLELSDRVIMGAPRQALLMNVGHRPVRPADADDLADLGDSGRRSLERRRCCAARAASGSPEILC